MKKIFNKLVITFSVLLFLACTDDSLDPFRFNDIQKGILLALRGDAFDNLNDNGCSNSFFYNNVLTTDTFTFDVEFLSEDQSLLQEVRIFALTIPTVKDKVAKPRTQVATASGDKFTIPSGGIHKEGTMSIPFADIKSALNLSDDEIKDLSKTELTIETDIVLTDGRTIASSSIVNSGLFESAIFYPAHKLSYCALDVEDARPKASLSLRGGKALKAGAKDTVDIVFDQDMNIASPVVTSIEPNQGSVGAVVEGKDGSSFYVIYTAPAGYTGIVTLTVSGGKSDDSGIELEQNDATFDISVDDEVPVWEGPLTTGGRIGRNQFTEIVVTFNEDIITKPVISVSGQNLDGVSDAKMDYKDPKNKKVLSYIFIWKDSDNDPSDATHGYLDILIEGGKDDAGNTHLPINETNTLVSDLAIPPAPTVVLDVPKHDYGTQVRWDVTQTSISVPLGSTEGTVYFVVLPDGAPAPTQRTIKVAGITMNNGFYQDWDKDVSYALGARVRVGDVIWESKIAANKNNKPAEDANWTEVSLTFGSSPVGDNVFADFLPNGDLDVYFYFVSSTGNVSPNTVAPLDVFMFTD